VTFHKPIHLQRTDGKGLVRRVAGLLGDHFPLGNARSKRRCRRESCQAAGTTSTNPAKPLLRTAQIGQTAGTLLGDESLKPQADQGGLLVDSSELGSIP